MRVYERGAERWEIELVGTRLVERTVVGGAVVDETSRECSSTAKAKWDLDRRCRHQIAAGFARVAGTDDIAAPSQGELVAALRADPDDLDLYAVYGDWLADRGDPWGELIAVQHALATLPRRGRRDELERAETLLRFQHGARLWGRLGETIVDEATQKYACDLIDATWHCGFLRAVRLTDNAITAELFAMIVGDLARLDIATVLREITLAGSQWPKGTIEVLLDQRWPAVEKVFVYRVDRHPESFDAARLARLVDGTVAPKLRHLDIATMHNADAACAALAASPLAGQLRSLHLVGTFSHAGIGALARAPLRLDELQLIGGGMPSDSEARLQSIAKIVKVAHHQVPADDDLDD